LIAVKKCFIIKIRNG
jgi:hypothetical protein